MKAYREATKACFNIIHKLKQKAGGEGGEIGDTDGLYREKR